MTEINIFKHSKDARTVEPGEALFRTGDNGDTMFAVVDGEVDLVLGDVVVETVGAGGILGELALIDHAPRSADAIVRAKANVVSIDQRQFTFLVHEHPTFALQVMTIMAERLRKTNEGIGGHRV